MPLRLDTRSPDFDASFNALLAMKREVAEDVDQAVQAIIADVVAHGDAALIGYSRKFDRVDLEKLGLRVSGADIDAAIARCPPEALDALRFAHDVVTGESTVLAQDPQADLQDVLRHPTERHVQAASFVYDRKRWQILDKSIEPDIAYLRDLADGDVEIPSRSLDAKFWIVLYVVDDGPVRFYLYDREQRRVQFLFTNRANLEQQTVAKMHSVVIKSRDGLDLVSYYTLPVGSDKPLPMVFIPHGGPHSRDFWGFNVWHQWLANRGYAVMSTNFRASTGFGKAFINAGNFEWGSKVLQDQIDAVLWAIQAEIADSKRVAVMGASFGGYSPSPA